MLTAAFLAPYVRVKDNNRTGECLALRDGGGGSIARGAVIPAPGFTPKCIGALCGAELNPQNRFRME